MYSVLKWNHTVYLSRLIWFLSTSMDKTWFCFSTVFFNLSFSDFTLFDIALHVLYVHVIPLNPYLCTLLSTLATSFIFWLVCSLVSNSIVVYSKCSLNTTRLWLNFLSGNSKASIGPSSKSLNPYWNSRSRHDRCKSTTPIDGSTSSHGRRAMATDAEGTSNETTEAPHETWPISKYNITRLFTTTLFYIACNWLLLSIRWRNYRKDFPFWNSDLFSSLPVARRPSLASLMHETFNSISHLS